MDRENKPAREDDLDAGRVGRAHGLDGSFYVTRSPPGLLTVGGVVTIAGQTRVIERVAGTTQRPIVRLQGIADRDAALGLKGLSLAVDSRQAPALNEGEWWAEELEGCTVVGGDRPLGTVSRLIELPSCEALEVRDGPGGEPLLIPMVKDAIHSVAISARRIDVNLDFLGLTGSAKDRGDPLSGDFDGAQQR